MLQHTVVHHGGHHTVTGSCHELKWGASSLLIDCGLFQGNERSEQSLEIDFSLDSVCGLVLTHSHIDHLGRLPWLIAAGFRQPIYCTPATAELVPLMLEDSLKLQTSLTAKQSSKVIDVIKQLMVPMEYGHWYSIDWFNHNSADIAYFNEWSVDLRFNPAGHILGSAFIECRLPNEDIVVFSGDLGPTHTPLLPDPISPPRADYLYIETTYGNKCHESVEQRSMRLAMIIDRSLADGGVILIPAFSVGRTQELLFDIERLIHEHDLQPDIPIILDSPMASKVTESYRHFKMLWGKEAKNRLSQHRHPLAFEQCITIPDYASHLKLVNRLASTGEPAIVAAASGMCEGGRIIDYLKALLPDSRTDVIFAGYQAVGTLGHELQSGQGHVDIDGVQVEVNVHIHSMSGYSAHADKEDLLRFIQGIKEKPKSIRLIHGVKTVQEDFAQELKMLGYDVES
ncbi:MBL fold metallo-hydrolase [Vibrio sp. CAIM 722]|uniref:MBL fold metallo-hydrolase n=1 Tax=Vibrio eleionomae TaxID=2653505 RepID=A0A7X4RX68_9VIBR|nr:MBL fold metallo-hydrolase [Vibrio eleionomae]MZI96024.1 MBL fold metallo-hydrolase [Vibrio eleionomae]